MELTYDKELWIEGLTGETPATKKLGMALVKRCDEAGVIQLSKDYLRKVVAREIESTSKVTALSFERLIAGRKVRQIRRSDRQTWTAAVYELTMAATPVVSTFAEPQHVLADVPRYGLSRLGDLVRIDLDAEAALSHDSAAS